MRDDFKKKAEKYAPKINVTEIKPIGTVDFVHDGSCYLDTKVVSAVEKECYSDGDSICLDFGRHVTGYFKFNMGQYSEYLDAPVRFKIKFEETAYEMYTDFDSYNGEMSLTWLQEEIINVDFKGLVRLPRRYAFRYARITVVKANYPVKLTDFTAETLTSADFSKLTECNAEGMLKDIDKVSVNTLAECMQDFLEDGPKRDRRLWLGDLRLQALADYYTFKNYDIVKRCLYLFAAFDREDKLLPSYVYTKPDLETGNAHLVSYALFFAVTLCDYFEHTGDREVVEDLFDTAKRQIDLTAKMMDKNGIVVMPEGYGWWTFVDWSDAEPVTANMGIYIYTVNAFAKLCGQLGRQEDAEHYTNFADKLKKSASEHLYDGAVFKNAYDNNQLSVHSQVWMILADVLTEEDAQRVLKECLNGDEYVKPRTPYMHHYVVDAMIKAGLLKEAKQYILDYWGEMVKLGADTFWEAFVKDDPNCSPYNAVLMNSSCHAWSCTPTYFIRKYNLK